MSTKTTGDIEITHIGPGENLLSSERFRAANHSSDTYWYYGYDPTLPIYSRQLESDTGWVEDPVGWCGTGLELYEFESEEAFEFEALRPPNDQSVWQVGIWFYLRKGSQDHEIYWSNSVIQ
ncbi:hypothetical protein ACFL45_07535 [Candidatus Neomarinimicrobiota bacterium]